MSERKAHMPSDVTGKVGVFDRFATAASRFFSKPGFFVFCLAVVVVWAPSFLILPNVDTWQLIINTTTTIITFLMVALLQNTQTRADKAIQDKLNAIADALADLSDDHAEGEKEAEAAIGVEERESA
ncbi:low affinity iron permease [Stackebrandtia albiflava]|uniref:Low affinity iron permease n=1 Tax=Stackebrandtia albiflava TaxID=406432 RepID=A0A562V9M9_9ACTN|nr:low affinity iron permease family protein [Stackebrandtia albiflava]TWJ14551.1 low affinity iron permease [Stackebrandtia albiflava]